MATKLYDIVEIELQNGNKAILKPLPIKALREFMGVGAELKKLGIRYTFATEPLAIYIVQPTPNNKVAIINKRYATNPDFVVGDIAVGIMD